MPNTSNIKAPQDRLKSTLALDEPVTRVDGVSAKRGAALARMGIKTVRDLLCNFPRRYLDMSEVCTVAGAQIGRSCTLSGRVFEVKLKRPRKGLSLVEITLQDATGALIVTAFRQPWLADKIKAGCVVAASGKVEFNYGFKRMTNPHIEVLAEAGTGAAGAGADGAGGGAAGGGAAGGGAAVIGAGSGGGEGAAKAPAPGAAFATTPVAHGVIIPIHPACAEISAANMRRLIGNALAQVGNLYDPLPLDVRAKYKLMSRGCALECIHFPKHMSEVAQARRRLIYEELLMIELFFMQEGAKRALGKVAFEHVVDGPHLAAFMAALPFELTQDQQAAVADVLGHMAAPRVANHMVLGDVGSGKTVVAACALAAAADSGGQAFMLAPTEVLAQQHAKGMAQMLEAASVSCALLTASTAPVERAEILDAFEVGALDVLIGTHALFEDDVRPKKLSLVVIDEQQRFGVDQRACLLTKGADCAPDALYLTATPIPRSLALAIFGNLTLSYIKQKPNKGAMRRTHVLEKRNKGVAYDAAKEAVYQGKQVYVVCPLVGVDAEGRNEAATARAWEADFEDEATYHPTVAIEGAGVEDFENLADVVNEANYLANSVFIDAEVGVLHGSMKAAEKSQVMQRFASGEIQVLVATTVIEVGVDVPNATVMIIEDADRFGLSQLHQLRGRVGRGADSADVYLISASKQEPALARLRALEQTDDGFEIASYDLSLRREGDILGNRQSGTSALKLVNVVRDAKIIEAAHDDAAAMIDADMPLEQKPHAALGREVRQLFHTSRIDYAVVGG